MSNAKSRTRRDHSLWDREVNALWDGKRPILSGEESLKAAKKLYRHAMGTAWRGHWKLTSGNRLTWGTGDTFYVNQNRTWGERGLRDIIHLISHWAHRRLHRFDKPHSIRQLQLERRLTKFAIARKWHEGTLATVKPAEAPTPAAKPDIVNQRYRRMLTRRDKWKAEQEVRAYERRHQERLAA